MVEEKTDLEQWACSLADEAAAAAGRDLLRVFLEEWFAQPRDPPVVGVPDDLARSQSDLRLALPALLLRPAPRPDRPGAPTAPRRRGGGRV